MNFKKLKWNKIESNKLVLQESNNHVFKDLSIDFRIIIGYDNKMYLIDFTSDNKLGYNANPIKNIAEGEKLAQKLFDSKCEEIIKALTDN